MLSNGQTIGVGITTRNRPYVVDVGLSHFEKYSQYIDRLVVVDDSSDDVCRDAVTASIAKSSLPITYRYSSKRLGISRAKNACLSSLENFDHVFLFDDDAWPKQLGWEEYWINCNKENNISHSMWLIDHPGLNSVISKIDTIGTGSSEMYAFSNCLGVALYFSNECIKTIGAYRYDVPNVYGYEHAHMSVRAQKAGLTAGHKYLTPSRLHEYIYSVDISLMWMGQEPPLTTLDRSLIGSSVTPQEVSASSNNSFLMNTDDGYIPIVDHIEA